MATIHELAELGDFQTLKAKINQKSRIINSVDENGDTCLMIAARNGNTDMVSFLLSKACDIDVKNSANETAVVVATISGNSAIAERLANLYGNMLDETDPGTPQIIFYSLYNQVNIVRILLDHYKVDVNATSDEGFTPLMAAATIEDSEELVHFLLGRGADPNAINVDGDNALLLAIAQENEPIASLLLNGHCDANHKSHDGDTPLMICVVKGLVEIAEDLIESGADLEASNKDGLTALHLSVLFNRVDMLQMLLEKGADPTACNNAGEDVMKIAIKNNNFEVVNILRPGSAPLKNPAEAPLKQLSADVMPAPRASSPTRTGAELGDLTGAAPASPLGNLTGDPSARPAQPKHLSLPPQSATHAIHELTTGAPVENPNPSVSRRGSSKSNSARNSPSTVAADAGAATTTRPPLAMGGLAGLSEKQIDAKIARAIRAQHEKFQESLNEMAEVLAITVHHELSEIKPLLENVGTGGGGGLGGGETERSWRKEVKVLLITILDSIQGQGRGDGSQSALTSSMMETLSRSTTPNQNMPQLLDSVVDQLQRSAEAAEQRVDAAVSRLGRSVKEMQEMLVEMHSFQRSKPYTAEQATATADAAAGEDRIDDATMRKFGGESESDSGNEERRSSPTARQRQALASPSTVGNSDEVIKLLRQLRHSQLLAFQQQEAEKAARVDVVQQLRGKLSDTENKLSSVERELMFMRANSSGGMSLSQIAASSLTDPPPMSPEYHPPEYRSSPADTETDDRGFQPPPAAAPGSDEGVLLGGYSMTVNVGRPASQPPRHHFPHAHHHHAHHHVHRTPIEPDMDRPPSPNTARALEFLKTEQIVLGSRAKESSSSSTNPNPSGVLQVDDLVNGHNNALHYAASGRQQQWRGGKPTSPPTKYSSPTTSSVVKRTSPTSASRVLSQYTESSLRKVGTNGGHEVLNSLLSNAVGQQGSSVERSLKNRPAMRFNGTSSKPMI